MAINLERPAISSYSFEDFIIARFRLNAPEIGAAKNNEPIAAVEMTVCTEPNKDGPPIRPINTFIMKAESPWFTRTSSEKVPALAIED